MEDNKNISILELKETSRTYIFPNGNELTIDNAVECRINKINTHQLVTKQGEVYIVPYKWLSMKYIPAVKDKKSD
ncbi:hypothetical protein ES708_17782 [subsurface metagenome]